MKNRLIIVLVIFTNSLLSCAQTNKETYNRFEQKANRFIEEQFNKNEIKSKKLIDNFEQFFIDKSIVEINDNDTIKYYKIIDYLMNSHGQDDFSQSVTKNASQLSKELENINLNKDIALICLYKVFDYYIENKKHGTIPNNFHVIGTSVSFLKKGEEIAPPLYMGALNIGRFKKEFYKKTVILLIYSLYCE